MKRYLTSYSQGKLKIRDRKTGQERTTSFCDNESAELLQSCIKATNYDLNIRKHSKVQTRQLSETIIQPKKTYLNWGDIPVSQIKWATSWYDPEKENKKSNDSILADRLNKLLEED